MVIIIQILLSFFFSSTAIVGTATWYDTSRHPLVHREYSTAAYCDWKYKNKKFIVTNLENNKSDTVVITDRHSNGPRHIDLSKSSFKKIAQPAQGRIRVKIQML